MVTFESVDKIHRPKGKPLWQYFYKVIFVFHQSKKNFCWILSMATFENNFQGTDLDRLHHGVHSPILSLDSFFHSSWSAWLDYLLHSRFALKDGGKKNPIKTIEMVSGVQTATTRVNEDGIKILFNCPRRDLAQKAKSRGDTLVTRAYINEST